MVLFENSFCSNNMEIKVYLVEQQNIIREGLTALLASGDNIKVTAECADLEKLPSLADCDVILIDYHGGLEPFLKKLRKIKNEFRHIKIIVLTGEEDTLDVLQAMLTAGVNGYLTKDASSEELHHSIRKVYDDGNYVCTAFVMRLLKNSKYFVNKPETIHLKDLEQELLNLIAEGLTNNDIAQQLHVSVRTIETRRKKLLEKTGTVNTANLIRFAAENGLLKNT